MKNFLKTLLAAFIGTLIALVISVFLFIGLLGTLVSFSDDSVPTVPKSAILKIDMSNPVTEQSSDDPIPSLASLSSLNFDANSKTIGILTMVQAIEKAAEDPAIKFLYLCPQNMMIGQAPLNELRAALLKFKASGKAIIAYADNYSQGSYYLASVADKVYMNKEGMAEMFGMSSNIMFFKDLLDKIGVNVQLIRHGKFKAASEQPIASDFSKENMQENKELIGSLWNKWLKDIGKSRNIEPEKLNSMVDNLELGLANSMLKNSLIDDAVTREEMSEKLCTLFSVEKAKDLEFISIANYAKASLKPNLKAKDKIAIIYANGEITMDKSEGISAKTFYPIIKKITADSSIKGVVLRVNSPGGDAQAAEIINQELQLLRKHKPLVVSFGDYAASGGYWISAKSDKIFTDANTITGAIGIFSLFMNYGKGLKKHLDINSVSIGSNQHSDMFSGLRSLDEKEVIYMQSFVEKIYTQFTGLVASGRSLPITYIDSVGQGRVWSGTDAIRIKLADKEGGLIDALNYTKELVGLTDYRVYEYPQVQNSLEKIMETISGAEKNVKAMANPIEIIENTYSYLKEYNNVKAYARMPYIYQFKY